MPHHLRNLAYAPRPLAAGTFFMRNPNSMFCATVLVGEQRVGLEHHAEPAIARLEIVHHLPVDANSPARILEARDQAQCRGLAAARRSDEHDELAVLNRKAQIRAPHDSHTSSSD